MRCGRGPRVVLLLTAKLCLACGAPKTAPDAPLPASAGVATEALSWVEAHGSSAEQLAALRRLTRDYEALHGADPDSNVVRRFVDRHVGELTDVLTRQRLEGRNPD